MSTSKKEKFVWDEKMTELYVNICAQEVRAGNKPTTHLNKIGWANLHEKFALLSKKNLDIKQLKNKWNNLKKDWQTWKRLLGNEAGLRWNVEKKVIEASDDWWEAKLKEIPVAVKFREKSLLLPNEMDLLFGDVGATGLHAQTSPIRILPMVQMIDTTLEGSGDSNNTPPARVVTEANIEVLESKDKGKGKRMHCCCCTNKTKKKQSHAQNVEVSLQRLSEIVESAQKTTDASMECCVGVLNSLNIKDDPDFFYECLYILAEERGFRETLCCLKEPETQLGFLKKVVMERKK